MKEYQGHFDSLFSQVQKVMDQKYYIGFTGLLPPEQQLTQQEQQKILEDAAKAKQELKNSLAYVQT